MTTRPVPLVRRARRALGWMWGELAPPGGPALVAGLTVLAVVALGLPACSDDDGAAPAGPAPTTGQQQLLESLLLTLEDMPAGWSELPLDDGEPMCGPDVDSVAVAFAADPLNGPALGIELSTGGDDLFDAQAEAMGGCEAERGGLHYAYGPLNVTQVGDRSAGFRAIITRPAAPEWPVGFRQDMVLVQVGDVVALVQAVDRQGGDTMELLARYAALAADRIAEGL